MFSKGVGDYIKAKHASGQLLYSLVTIPMTIGIIVIIGAEVKLIAKTYENGAFLGKTT